MSAVWWRNRKCNIFSFIVQDVLWATKGLVVTVMNGEAIPVLQRRIYDGGFESLVVIPLGADKVFLRTTDEGDVSNILSEVVDFFCNFFSTSVKWNKDIVGFERGVWVCIYGVPLHAWNLNFFKLCVCDIGRLMRIDEFTLDKERLDYARVLVAMSSLDVLNVIAKFVVDGVLVNFKVVEEWGFSLGEDDCLGIEEDVSEEDRSDMLDSHDKLSDNWQEERREGFVPCSNGTCYVTQMVASCELEPHKIEHGQQDNLDINSTLNINSTPNNIILTPLGGGTANVNSFIPEVVETNVTLKGAASNNGTTQSPLLADGERSSRLDQLLKGPRVLKRTTSCPPGRGRSTTTGPWSLE